MAGPYGQNGVVRIIRTRTSPSFLRTSRISPSSMTFRPISGSTTWRRASRTLSAALGSSESISQIVRGVLSVSAMHRLLRHRRDRERTVDVAVEQAGDPLHRQGEGRGDERLIDHTDFGMLLTHAEVGA